MKEPIGLLWGICWGTIAICLHLRYGLGRVSFGLLLTFAIVGGIAIVNCDVVKRWKGLGVEVETVRDQINTAKDRAIAEIRQEVSKQKEVLALWVKVLDGLIRKDFELVLEDIGELARREPENYYILQTWGNVLFSYAEREEGDKEKELIKKAEEIYIKADSLKKGSCAYSLACIRAFDADEKECKRWLQIAEEAGELPTLERAMRDKYLKSVRDKEWFKEIGWAEQ
ncbi:MAG: hypothetical protein ABIL62_03960 [Planctomycetota bacterium]